jgi:hypothetical protein
MPAVLVEVPLGVTCVFSDGRRAEFCLDGLPEPRLARDLLIGLIELIHPHGSVDAPGSVMHFVSAARSMVANAVRAGILRRRRPAEPGSTGRVLDERIDW